MSQLAASTALVTDSTANLPTSMIDFWGLRVVPVQVIIGDRAGEEGVDVTTADVAAALRSGVPVSTSRPSPARFAQVYADAAAAGAEHIVSAHLSADLSGTYDAALLAAADSSVPVTVVDSRSVSMGLGYGVIAGARVLARDATPAQAAEAIVATSAVSRVLFYVDSLEFLRRGGRIGAAQRLVGSALAVKPILHLAKGRVQPLEKVRTAARAMSRLEDLAVESAGDVPVGIAVMHLDAERRAADVADHLRARLPDADVLQGDVGAVIGSHVGPGMVAVIVSPVPEP
ncbi:MAG: DegV family protein [Candidatus Nanopelagicales bacterium]